MHFRQLIAVVVNEFAAHQFKMLPNAKTPNEFRSFLSELKCRTELVHQIFIILFGQPPIFKEVRVYVEACLRKPESLIGVRYKISHLPRVVCKTNIYYYFTIYFQLIFKDTILQVRNRQWKFVESDFHNYKINMN